MQLPLDFGKPGTPRAVPLTVSVTFPAFKATATLSVRRPGWGARAIRYAQPSLSLATVIKLATLVEVRLDFGAGGNPRRSRRLPAAAEAVQTEVHP